MSGDLHITGVDYLSPSQMAVLTSCERRWYWSYVHKLKEGSSEPLAMGGGMAAALEHGDLEKGLVEYRLRRPPVDAFTDPVVYERQGWIGEATIREAYAGYTLRWPDVDVARESTYIVDLPGTARLLQVRVDGVAPAHLIEDKLRSGASMQSSAIENEVRQGRQLTAEVYVKFRDTGELLPVHLRCVKKIDPRKVKTLGTEAEVVEAIGLHFAADNVFNEWQATRTEAQLAEFVTECAELGNRADGLVKDGDMDFAVKNQGHCHAFGRACPALAHCQNMASVEDILPMAKAA